MINFRVDMSLSAKAMFINSAVTFLIVLLFAVLLFSHQQRVEQQIQQQTLMLSNSLNDTFHSKQRVIDNEVELLRHNEALMDRLLQVELENNASTLPLPKPLLDQLNHDIFILYDTKGVVVARHGIHAQAILSASKNRPSHNFYDNNGVAMHGQTGLSDDLIPMALRSKPLRGFLQSTEGLMLIAQAPVVYGKEIVGYVTLGDLLNKDTLPDLLTDRGDGAAIRLFVNHTEWMTTDAAFEFSGGPQINLGYALDSGDDVTFSVGIDSEAIRSAGYQFFIWLALALLLGVLTWWFLYHRLIGDIVIRLESMQESLGKLQIGDIYPAPERVVDAIDMVGRGLYSMSRRLQMKTEKLQMERQTLLSITNAAPIWIWQTDDSGRLIFTNKSMCEMLYVKRPEGRYLNELMSLEAGGQSSKLPDLNDNCEAICKVRVNDQVHDMHIIMVKQKSSSGHIIGMIGLAVDMTEQLKLESDFRHAQKMESLGTLVGGVAHNFNNILAGMVGHIFLAKKKSVAQTDVLKHLDKLEDASSRATDMVKQLLAFAQKDMDRKENVDLKAAIEESHGMIKSALTADIRFEMELCEESISVYGNISALQQVFVNLVVNARDAVEAASDKLITARLDYLAVDGEVKQAHPALEADHLACLSVEDHGMGIDGDEIEHIFEPFFSTKVVGEATGLGLSMSVGTVESCGGWIDVDSVVGEGTVFRVYLPLSSGEQGERHPTELCLSEGHGEQVLLVDDDEMLLEVGKEILESLDYRVLIASNGEEALALFKQHASEINLVMSDVTMPVMGGIELCKLIREQNGAMPIVFVSGYHKDALGMVDIDQRCNGVLSKPYNIEEVSCLLSELLSAGKAQVDS